MHPSFVREGEKPKYPPTTGREYLLMKLRESKVAPAAAAT